MDPPPPNDHLLLAGRRWQVIDVDTQREEINVKPARGKKATPFTGSGGEIHDRVRTKMKEVVLGTKPIPYLNQGALDWLREARAIATDAGLDRTAWHDISSNTCLLFTWSGSRTQRAIVLFARHAGIDSVDRDVAVEFRAPQRVARHKLLAVLRRDVSLDDLLDQEPFQERRKYDCFLPKALLRKSFADNALNMERCVSLLDEACSGG
jgi:ATP-dependent Lhr-like helicase